MAVLEPPGEIDTAREEAVGGLVRDISHSRAAIRSNNVGAGAASATSPESLVGTPSVDSMEVGVAITGWFTGSGKAMGPV